MCDQFGLDKEWVSRGVQWYEDHPLTQPCTTWWRRNGRTYSEVSGNAITQEGAAHASQVQSLAAVRSEIATRARENPLTPGEMKAMSVDEIKARQNQEGAKKTAAAALRGMDDKALESWISDYCEQNAADTLHDATAALFYELKRPR
jgi:hypothetical protein